MVLALRELFFLELFAKVLHLTRAVSRSWRKDECNPSELESLV